MLPFSIRLLRHSKPLLRRNPLRPAPQKYFHSQTPFMNKEILYNTNYKEHFEDFFLRPSADGTDNNLKEAVTILQKHSASRTINWEHVMREFADLKISNPREMIMKACLRLGRLDIGLSHYKYTAKEELTVEELLLLTKLLMQCSDDVSKFQDIVLDIYEKLKLYMFSSSVIKSVMLKMFIKFPYCFWDSVKNIRKNRIPGNGALVFRAFEIDEPEVGWDFMQDHDFELSNIFLKTYLEYCTRKALDGSFSVDMINNLVDICYKKMCYISSNKLVFDFKPLVEVLMKNKNDYILSVEKCEIDSENVCSNCGLQLKSTPITAEELDMLKKNFFDSVLNNTYTNMRSPKSEINNFKIFLENCEPYDLVIDGLNLLYAGKSLGTKIYNDYLKYFLEKGMKILIIGRHHSIGMLKKPLFLRQRKYNRMIQFFSTSDMADDDIFTLYSAMHGGLGTFFCAADHYSCYGSRMSEEANILYRKWKISHQYLIRHNNTFVCPWPHMGLPQLTAAPDTGSNCYVWHLSHMLSKDPLSRLTDIQWACLKATPRKNKAK